MNRVSGFYVLVLAAAAASFPACLDQRRPAESEPRPQTRDVGKSTRPPAAENGSGPAINAPETAPPEPKFESVYTDTAETRCRTTDQNEDEGWIVQECPGVGGYKLEITEGDLRQTINLISPSGKKTELDLQGVVSSGFSAIGDKAEWRVERSSGKARPVSLIVRFNVSEDPEKPDRTTSYLVVSKITEPEICVTDIVRPIAGANEKARELADTASKKPCKNKQ